jgi:hypothetical protein
LHRSAHGGSGRADRPAIRGIRSLLWGSQSCLTTAVRPLHLILSPCPVAWSVTGWVDGGV